MRSSAVAWGGAQNFFTSPGGRGRRCLQRRVREGRFQRTGNELQSSSLQCVNVWTAKCDKKRTVRTNAKGAKPGSTPFRVIRVSFAWHRRCFAVQMIPSPPPSLPRLHCVKTGEGEESRCAPTEDRATRAAQTSRRPGQTAPTYRPGPGRASRTGCSNHTCCPRRSTGCLPGGSRWSTSNTCPSSHRCSAP